MAAPHASSCPQLLVDVLGVEDVGAYYPHRVTYHPTCHSLRLLRVGDRPLRLLRQCRGPGAGASCPTPRCAAASAARSRSRTPTPPPRCWPTRCANVLATRAEVCTAGDSSCLMHIGGGLSRLRAGVRTVHLAEILASTRDQPVSTFLGMPTAPRGVGPPARRPSRSRWRRAARWPTASCAATWARPPRRSGPSAAAVVGELPDWEELREAGQAIKAAHDGHLDRYLVQLEEQVTARGGTVHWARDAAEANRIVAGLVQAAGATEVVKVKSMATDEIGLNEALAAAGIAAYETDLAELIVQLGHDRPSHILVPAIHRNRAEIREIFLREMADVDPGLTDDPAALAEAARLHLRRKFLSAPGRRSAGPTSPSRRPARCAWSSRRATAGCA